MCSKHRKDILKTSVNSIVVSLLLTENTYNTLNTLMCRCCFQVWKNYCLLGLLPTWNKFFHIILVSVFRLVTCFSLDDKIADWKNDKAKLYNRTIDKLHLQCCSHAYSNRTLFIDGLIFEILCSYLQQWPWDVPRPRDKTHNLQFLWFYMINYYDQWLVHMNNYHFGKDHKTIL